MSQINVGDEPVLIEISSAVIQNLGPATLFLGGSSVTPQDGLRIDVGQSVSIGNGSFYGVAGDDGECDVRYASPVTGIHD